MNPESRLSPRARVARWAAGASSLRVTATLMPSRLWSNRSVDNRESEIRVGFVNPRYNSALVALAYFAGGALLYVLNLGVLVEDRPPRPLWVWLILLACVCAP